MAYPENTIVEVRIVYSVNGQTCMNVTHWDPEDNAAGWTPLEAEEELATAIRDQGEGGLLKEMRDFMSQDAVVTEIQVQAIWPTRFRTFALPINLAGVVAQDCTAQNVQGSIEKFGEIADRHNIGAFHLGGVPVTAYDAGELTGAAVAQLGNVATALMTPITTANAPVTTYNPVILNKEKTIVDGKPHYEIIGFSRVYGATAKTELRVMNRRTVGRGI